MADKQLSLEELSRLANDENVDPGTVTAIPMGMAGATAEDEEELNYQRLLEELTKREEERIARETAQALAQAPKPSALELAATTAGGAATGISESVTSLFGLPALAEMGVGAVESLPENVQRIREFLAVATPQQKAELLSGAGEQTGSLITSLIPGGAYTQERLASESPTVKRALGLLPPATPEQAYREETGKSLEEASALRRLYENVSTTLGTGARMAFPALKMADIILPETRREAEMLGEEVGQAIGPTALMRGGKALAKVTQAGVEKLPPGIKNVGQNKAIELVNAAKTSGGAVTKLKALFRTAEAEYPFFEDVQKYEKWFKSKNPLKGIPTDEANAPYLFERIIGTQDELGNRAPDGVFRKIIDQAKRDKEQILVDADAKIPQGLKKEDFNFKRLEDAIEQARTSGFEAEQLKELEKANRVFKRDVLGTNVVYVGAKPVVRDMFTVQDSQEYLRMLDRQLTELGAFDDRIWKNLATNPSVTENLKKRVNALKSIRATVYDAQQNAVRNALGAKAAESLKSLNADIAGSIEFESLFKRFFAQTLQGATTPAGASLNKTIRESGFAPTRIIGVNKVIEPFVPGPVTKSALEQAEAVKALQDISDAYQGLTPEVTPRKLEGLTELLGKGAAPMTPEQLATTAGLGYTSAIAPENQAQAAEIPASLLQLLAQPQPPMTPATPEAMAPASLLQTLAQPGAEGQGMGESLVPGADAANEMQQVQGADFIQQMSGQPGPGLAGTEMPQAPEAPLMEPIQGMLGGLPPMGGAGQMAEGPSLMAAQRKPFKPVKPTMDNVIDNAGAIAQEITSLLGPEEANNVLQQLQEAIQSKNDMAVGKVVTAFTKAYPEAQNIFEDEYPDMPIFTFNGKIYQPDDRQAYEKWLTQTNASSIEKAKSLSALNTDGTVRLPKGR